MCRLVSIQSCVFELRHVSSTQLFQLSLIMMVHLCVRARVREGEKGNESERVSERENYRERERVRERARARESERERE